MRHKHLPMNRPEPEGDDLQENFLLDSHVTLASSDTESDDIALPVSETITTDGAGADGTAQRSGPSASKAEPAPARTPSDKKRKRKEAHDEKSKVSLFFQERQGGSYTKSFILSDFPL